MQFEASKKETKILDPLKQNKQRVIMSEIRKDPLTGRTSRICHFMKLKWQKPDFEKLIAGTAETCPFCSEKVMEITPCFPHEITPKGRFVLDDMVLFPNLAPYDSLSAVATLGKQHYIPMTELEPTRITIGFLLAMKYFKKLEEIGHPESVYHIINWNYMPVSGSSLIHPHLQVFSTSTAPNLMRQENLAAKAYRKRHTANYWDDLITYEKQNKTRFLGEIGRTVWLSNYAPMGVAGDVLAVVKGACSTMELKEKDLLDLSTGLKRVMLAYDKMGIYSFNMNFFTGEINDNDVRFHLVFSPRTFFNERLGTPDVGALRNLFNETLCMAYPEDINSMLKLEFPQD